MQISIDPNLVQIGEPKYEVILDITKRMKNALENIMLAIVNLAVGYKQVCYGTQCSI